MKPNLRTSVLAMLLAFLLAAPAFATAAVPYESYNYDYWGDIIFTPVPYAPNGSISGVTLGVGSFNTPQDLSVAPDGKVYIADTGNNRIVILDETMTRSLGIIDSFADEEGNVQSFSSPYGVTVSETGQIYIADTGNSRIVALDTDGNLCRIIQNPVSEVLADDFVFYPLKAAVDYADRVYCTARNMFQGIMVFNEEGSFTGFYGTIAVTLTPWQKFWRRFSTKEQRARQQLFIPTEFTGVDVDEKGFIYASNVDPAGTQAIRRLNPKGQDVIVMGVSRNLGGDVQASMGNQYTGPSVIVDTAVRDRGVYTLLDSKRGRLFTYDNEGNLLYIFGGLGNQIGSFRTPTALEYHGRDILVLDATRNELMFFTETQYGRLINDAVGLRYDGDETQAVAMWQDVLKLNENLELANTGIGKAYLTSGDNQTAMKYLKMGMNRAYYSIAFKRYRNEILKENLGVILTAGLLLLAGGFILSRLRRRGKPRKGGLLDGD